MTETYGMPVQVGARPIVAPIGAGEARIPALVRLPGERLLLFYDERPAPASALVLRRAASGQLPQFQVAGQRLVHGLVREGDGRAVR